MPKKKASKASKKRSPTRAAAAKRARKAPAASPAESEPHPSAEPDTGTIDTALLETIRQRGGDAKLFRVRIDINLLYAEGRDAARQRARDLVEKVVAGAPERGIDTKKSEFSDHFFARLTGREITQLIEADLANPARCIFKVWLDRDSFANLDTTSIDVPLLERMRQRGGATEPFRVIIDVNLLYADGRDAARQQTRKLIENIVGDAPDRGIDEIKSSFSDQYFFARLTGEDIKTLILQDAKTPPRCIYKIWLDFEVQAQLTQSLSTVKADAARAAFSAAGDRVCWAVIDSGIEGKHEHFQLQQNLKVNDPVRHVDFTGDMVKLFDNDSAKLMDELTDEFGHGTHVAGIIAGEVTDGPVRTITRRRDESGDVSYSVNDVPTISGVAPKCKLVSLKVLNERGRGLVSNLIAAIGYIQKINDHGRWLQIHGVNMSVGYEFDAEWFGCGQSPLCVEVDRLVRTGVVVVVAAGNTGYGIAQSADGDFKTGLDVTINDPGNAALAITVGATHREKPHLYGVSYFSSKGPTGDGRLKPDVVAPGEKIISCAAGSKKLDIEKSVGVNNFADNRDYFEQSGTSMAAPHVSGAIAAFLSIRREFIGQPERIKEIFLSTATDLGRDRYFQGHGLIDLMRAIQSV